MSPSMIFRAGSPPDLPKLSPSNLDQARGVDFGNSALTNVTILSPSELLATTQATGFPSTTLLQLHISDATVSGYAQARLASAFAYTKSTSPLMASFAVPALGATVNG